ncbi:MAG TPA: M48 family metalloprotease [Bryobacteraceae bacterium]
MSRSILPLVATAAVLWSGSSALAKSVKIHGYVTSIKSATEFEIDEYRITRDASLTLELEKSDDPEEITTFTPEEIRVGTELEIRGELDEATNQLTAKTIKVNLDEHLHLKRTALMEAAPEIRKAGNAWEGQIHIDGQRVTIDENTVVTIKPNSAQKKAAKDSEKAAQKRKQPGANSEGGEAPSVVLKEPDQIPANTFVTYEGLRQKDGTVRAKKVEFQESEVTPGESRLWKTLTPKIKAANFTNGRPGELRIQQVGKFKLLPDAEVQKYVQDLGSSLIPKYQRELPAGDPQKIPFQFFVVDEKVPNAFALANGTVVIHSGLLTVLESEAQLASVISHEISHATEKHTYRQMQYHKKALTALKIGAAVGSIWGGRSVIDLANLTEGAIRNGYSRSLENQADRIGMEYMMTAGYDPREAARVWKVMAVKLGEQSTNFFWSNHDNHATRRTYLMAELRNNYSGIDFEGYKRNTERFTAAVTALKSRGAPKKIKVKY